jgi:hypothetical protein
MAAGHFTKASSSIQLQTNPQQGSAREAYFRIEFAAYQFRN